MSRTAVKTFRKNEKLQGIRCISGVTVHLRCIANSTSLSTASTHLPRKVRLPHLPHVYLQRRQPAPAVEVSVDALDEAQVQNLAARLRRVADDGDFAGGVACHWGGR